MRSGWVDLGSGHSHSVGTNDYGWSRVSGSESGAYFLTTDPIAVYPSTNSYRFYGFPLSISTIVQLPLSFVRSGGVDLSYGWAWNFGYDGFAWSQVSSSATIAYHLGITSTIVIPSRDYTNRGLGFPLYAD